MKSIDETTKFYKKWFKEENFEKKLNMKRDFIFKKTNGSIYKFIAFKNDKEKLNDSKKLCLLNNKLWISCIFNFSDSSEFLMSVDYEKASRETGASIKTLKEFASSIREFEDIVCFTSNITDKMRDEYANNHNGVCLKFEILDYDAYYPVIYIDKDNFDYTQLLIKAWNVPKNDISCLSNYYLNKFSEYVTVIKDKTKFEFEQEIRFRYSDSLNSIFCNTVCSNMKMENGYHGISKTYEECGLKIKKIFLGKNLNHDIKTALLNDYNIKKYIDIKNTSY